MGVAETEHQNEEFVLHSREVKVLVKMGRIEVAAKTGVVLLFIYFDLICDVLVLFRFCAARRTGLARVSGSCVALSLLFQAPLILKQYKERQAVIDFLRRIQLTVLHETLQTKKWKGRELRTLLSLFCLTTFLESYDN